MPVFRLDPVVDRLNDPSWAASRFKEACWIIERDEADARPPHQHLHVTTADLAALGSQQASQHPRAGEGELQMQLRRKGGGGLSQPAGGGVVGIVTKSLKVCTLETPFMPAARREVLQKAKQLAKFAGPSINKLCF
jgi:hypothetical protein